MPPHDNPDPWWLNTGDKPFWGFLGAVVTGIVTMLGMKKRKRVDGEMFESAHAANQNVLAEILRSINRNNDKMDEVKGYQESSLNEIKRQLGSLQDQMGGLENRMTLIEQAPRPQA